MNQKLPPDYKQQRIFINNVNSITGQALVEILRTDYLTDDIPHLIIGTRLQSDLDKNTEIPRGVSHILENKSVSVLGKLFNDCDVIVFDIENTNLDEIKFALQVCKLGNYTHTKVFILLSSPMVWSKTAPKEKLYPGDKDDIEGIDERGNKIYYYTENDYEYRRCFPKYELYKQIENYCINCSHSRPNLKAYVICPGILYGHGETIFYKLFRQAFASHPMELTYSNDGMNIIPTIYVQDLVNLIIRIIKTMPSQNYIFAVDYGKNQTKKNLVQAISSTLGTGLTRQVPFMDSAHEPFYEIMNLNVRLRPTQLFEPNFKLQKIKELNEKEIIIPTKRPKILNQNNLDFDAKSEESFLDSVTDEEPVQPFNWLYKEGIIQNIKLISEEFLNYRGLKPNRIFLCGPPSVGKTYFGQLISEQYHLPYICVREIAERGKSRNDELGDEIRAKLAELKQKMVEEALVIFEAEEKKKKKKKDYIPQQFDDSKLIPKIPEVYINRLFKARLNQNDCKFKGYVLDGYPKSMESAKEIFVDKIVIEKKVSIEKSNEHSQELKEQKQTQQQQQSQDQLQSELETEQIVKETQEQLNTQILPQHVLYLEATDEFLKDKMKKLNPSLIEGTHYNEEGMNRRLPIYRKINVSEESGQHVASYFRQLNIPVQKFDLNELEAKVKEINEKQEEQIQDKQEQEQQTEKKTITLNDLMMQELLQFIEKEGKFKTYEEWIDQRDLDLEQQLKLENEQLKKQIETENAEKLKQEQHQRQLMIEEEINQLKLKDIQFKEKDILDQKSYSIRQYLADLVIPSLMEGLIEIAKKDPEDPLDYLADYLLTKSNELEQDENIVF